MRVLSALLFLGFLPMIGHANCLEEDGSVLWESRRGLPASVSAEERQRVESLAGTQVDYVVCGLIVPGIRIDSDRGQIGAVARGYFALTGKSVIFVRAERGVVLPRYKYDVAFDASYDELSDITVPSSYVGPNVMMDLGTDSSGALVEVPRGGNGEAIVAELRTRLIAACGTPIFLTASEVRCR